MSDAKEKVKEDVLKNPEHVLVTIQVLMLQEKSIFEAYKEFCKAFGDDAISYGDFDFWWFRFLNGECDLDYDRSKEPKKRELGDMPNEIFEKIVGNLKIMERYVLPDVSKRIRNVMEDSNLLFSKLYLEVCYDCIGIYFNGRNAKFEDSNPGTLVRIGDTTRMVKGDHLTVAMNQLTRILKNPKLRFGYLNVYFGVERNFNAVQKAFQSITHQIHVKTLNISIRSNNQLMTILPNLKPGVLETIDIFSRIRDLPGFVELEQFKQAKSFSSIGCLFDAPIEKLLHLNHFEVMLNTISVENVIRIKDAFLASPNLKKCFIHQENLDNLRLLEALDGKVFAIPGSEDSIRIRVTQFRVSIKRITDS